MGRFDAPRQAVPGPTEGATTHRRSVLRKIWWFRGLDSCVTVQFAPKTDLSRVRFVRSSVCYWHHLSNRSKSDARLSVVRSWVSALSLRSALRRCRPVARATSRSGARTRRTRLNSACGFLTTARRKHPGAHLPITWKGLGRKTYLRVVQNAFSGDDAMRRHQVGQVGIFMPYSGNLAFFEMISRDEKMLFGMYVRVWHIFGLFSGVGGKKRLAFLRTVSR